MTDAWTDLIGGDRWRSPGTLWVEDGTEYSGAQIGKLASAIEEAIHEHAASRVVRIRSRSKLGCFAGQLASWRAGCVAVADDGNLGPSEIDRIRPDLTLAVSSDGVAAVELTRRQEGALPRTRLPAEVVAVNFTSGSTGSRKAVAVTRGNLLALFGCRDLDVPAGAGLNSGSFATPAYDGWWFDTWRTVSAGGTVVCLPNVNEDVLAWPELAETYRIGRVLLPAAVLATVIDTVPECIAGIPWLFSGGEQFQVPTYQQARRAGLTNKFVNLYGPTEATFATHRYELPGAGVVAPIPIGKPLDGCQQRLRELGEQERGSRELIVVGPFVCLGYIEQGAIASRFRSDDGQASFGTGDVVRFDDRGNLVFAGRLDNRIKVNGMRVDAAALEHQVTGLPSVLDCRVVQNELLTVAFVRVDTESLADLTVRSRVESVVKSFSPAIRVRLADRFPTKSGGKVDTNCLMDYYYSADRDGEQ